MLCDQINNKLFFKAANMFSLSFKGKYGEFPSNAVVRILYSHCWGPVREIKWRQSCSGFRGKRAEQASDLSSDLPRYCPDYCSTAVSVTSAVSAERRHRYTESGSWDLLNPWKGSGQPLLGPNKLPRYTEQSKQHCKKKINIIPDLQFCL